MVKARKGRTTLRSGLTEPRSNNSSESWFFKARRVQQSQYHPQAIRYDVGQRSNQILLPMLIADLDHLLECSPEKIQGYCYKLIQPLLNEVGSLGYWVEEQRWRASHLFGLRIPSTLDIKDIQLALLTHNISVSVRGNAIRISPHVYNDASN